MPKPVFPHGIAVRRYGRTVVMLAGMLLGPVLSPVRAETGYDAWLRYARLDEKTARDQYAELPAIVVAVGDSAVVKSAQTELIRGLRGMLGRTLRAGVELPKENAILLGTFDDVKQAVPSIGKMPKLAEDGYWLTRVELDNTNYLVITAPNDRGVLYGTFTLLRKIAWGQKLESLNERQSPYAPLRVINQWDHPDGTVEAGYAGKSIFWNGGHVVKDLTRAGDYARLLASIGVNGLSINRGDAAGRVLSTEAIKELARVADVLRPWGVKLYVALDSANLPATSARNRSRHSDADQMSWKKKVEEIYAAIPDFGGFVLDAQLDGRFDATDASPAHVAATKALAEALQPHGGILFYRCAVSDADVDAGDPKADPAKTVYDQLHSLDGQFGDNVVLQIKNGPIDFQVREAPSPLLGGLRETNQVIELSISQEYLGQQRHVCFLVPMWKWVLNFDMHATADETPIHALVAGKTFERPLGGFIGVANVGSDANWLGHDLAMANLYGFGRLAWDPALTSKTIADEWAQLTFGNDPLVTGTIVDLLLKSWRMVENYTGPLGMGTLTDLANTHYGPAIEASGPGAWRSWHSADATGVGRDRTAATGTGFVAQYPEAVAKRFEAVDSCPDDLLLFMHHVPFEHPLKSGKTVIQHVYDSHYTAARDAGKFVDRWQALRGRIDDERYDAVLARLHYQAGHAQLWRDAVCMWFLHQSGIADNEDRVGSYPNRFEAESLERDGYESLNVTPWETASRGQCAEVVAGSRHGWIELKYDGKAGWFDVNVRYFDENDGVSRFRLLVGGQIVDEWTSSDTLPDDEPNGQTSTRHQSSRVALRPGDEIRIEATSDGSERAAIDYLEIEPAAG